MKLKISQNFFILNLNLEIISNSADWLDFINKNISLPVSETNSKPDLQLNLFSIEETLIDSCLPVTNDYILKNTYEIEAGGIKSAARDYSFMELRIIDITSCGRVKINYSEGSAWVYKYTHTALPALPVHIILGINTLSNILSKADLHYIHGACVEIDGVGVIISGQSGRGKSTAAFAASIGQTLLADDRIHLGVNSEGNIHAITFTDIFKLRQPSIDKFFPFMKEYTPVYEFDGEFYYKASEMNSETSGGSTLLSFKTSAEVKKLIILNKTLQEKSSFQRIPALSVMEELLPFSLNLDVEYILERKFAFLMDFMSRIECFQVNFGTDMEHFRAVLKDCIRMG